MTDKTCEECVDGKVGLRTYDIGTQQYRMKWFDCEACKGTGREPEKEDEDDR